MNRALLAVIPLCALATEARADLLSMRVEGHTGGLGGKSLSGPVGDAEQGFYDGARGPAWGFLVGLEALFIDAWVEHHQVVDVSGPDLLGTWTQFMVGLDLDLENREDVTDPEAQKRGEKGKLESYFEMGLGVGYGVGTGQQVELPLDASEVSDKGFLLEAKLGGGIVVGNVIYLGVSVPVSAGYLFKSGFANDESNQYWSAQGGVLLVARGKIKLK